MNELERGATNLHEVGLTIVEEDGTYSLASIDREVNIWPRILEEMYSTGGSAVVSIENTGNKELERQHPLLEQVEGVSEKNLYPAIQLLKRAELVEEIEKKSSEVKVNALRLTKDGFEVAHERELAENQQETNENIAFFTLILMFAAILQTIAAAVQLENVGNELGLLLLTLLLTLTVAFYQSHPTQWFRNITSGFRA